MRKGICNCLVLYDLQSKDAHLKEWYGRIIKWLADYNLTPKRMGVSGDRVKQSNYTKTFKHYDKVLRELSFKEINHIWIGAFPPNFETDDDGDAFFTVHLRLQSSNTSLVLCFDDSIRSFDPSYVETLGKEMASYFDARYGIAYQRDFTKGPGWYAFGAIGSAGNVRISDEEEDLITKWLHAYGKEGYTLGDLRDIYPINFLSKPHLERGVDGKSLGQWISSSKNHGTLQQLSDNLWSWIVPNDEISNVREALRPSGMLICI